VSPSPGPLDRLAKFFTSLTGVITAAVLLAGAIGGAVAYLKGGGGDGGTDTGTSTHVSPVPPPPPSPVPPPRPSLVPPPPPSLPGPASLFTNRDSGPGGTTVLLSGDGFDPGERVVLRFHTEQIGSTTALLSRGIPAYPRSVRKRQDRPVTPEVAVRVPSLPSFVQAVPFVDAGWSSSGPSSVVLAWSRDCGSRLLPPSTGSREPQRLRYGVIVTTEPLPNTSILA
jgi:hypothetical protein